MNILYLTPGCFDKGGISRYSRYQIRALQDIYGVDAVRILSMLGPDEHQFEDKFEVYWHGTGSNKTSKLNFVGKTLGLLEKWKPDVLHSAHVNYGGLISAISKRYASTTVLNVYGIEVWSNPSWHAKYGMRNIDEIISDCHNTANYVSKHFREGVQPEVIWDCVDLEHFRYNESRFQEVAARYELPDKNRHLTILTLGRLAEDAAYKGYGRLIDVFANVYQQYPHVRLIIGGKGNLVPELSEQVQNRGLTHAVVFTGSVAEEDLPVLYAYADIFSMVTESGDGKGEGIPLTPLEAMACRTPIIVGNQDGSREAVFDGTNGYIIDPLDLVEHERVIIELITDQKRRQRMSLAAEQVAHAQFSYIGFREKHREFYQRLTVK